MVCQYYRQGAGTIVNPSYSKNRMKYLQDEIVKLDKTGNGGFATVLKGFLLSDGGDKGGKFS
jgi:hypothetical protein